MLIKQKPQPIGWQFGYIFSCPMRIQCLECGLKSAGKPPRQVPAVLWGRAFNEASNVGTAQRLHFSSHRATLLKMDRGATSWDN